MAKIFWLASYPKSGNTWMRMLLTNYLRNPSNPSDINKAKYGTIAASRAWFDEWAGVEASALDDKTIECLRPDVYRCMADEEQETVYMKVHDAWGRTDQGEGIFPVDVTGGVVYILRNPLDMAASCANHWGVDLNQAVDNMCDQTFALSRSLGVMADQLRQYMGSWSDHVASWMDQADLPIHLVRYEDLQRDPENYFGDVVRFCGLPWDSERVSKAVMFSDFKELQRQERDNDFRERSPKAPAPFFRKGQVGSWREELPQELAQRLIEAHGEVMLRFGYLDNDYRPI